MDKVIVNHETPEYQAKRAVLRESMHNGAYYYSIEINKFFIPNIRTTRNWITVNCKGIGIDHAIVFVHNNLHPEWYEWLSDYEDLILVCGVPSTCDKVAHLGKTIYLPLSVDVKEVEQYRTEKTKGTAFVGRKEKRYGCDIPHTINYLEGLERDKLLQMVAQYRRIYAVGRTAIEGKILGCEILPYDERFPDPSVWQIFDSRDACKLLQKKLDEIDKR